MTMGSVDTMSDWVWQARRFREYNHREEGSEPTTGRESLIDLSEGYLSARSPASLGQTSRAPTVETNSPLRLDSTELRPSSR